MSSEAVWVQCAMRALVALAAPALLVPPLRCPRLAMTLTPTEYLVGPIDVGPSEAFVERHPDLKTPRMQIIGKQSRMTDEAVEQFCDFLQDSMDLDVRFSVLWDVRRESFPSLNQCRIVLSWLNQGERAAVYDSRVTCHYLVLRNPLLRTGVAVMARLANPPQPVKCASSDAQAIEFALLHDEAGAEAEAEADDEATGSSIERPHAGTEAAEAGGAPEPTASRESHASSSTLEHLDMDMDMDIHTETRAEQLGHPGWPTADTHRRLRLGKLQLSWPRRQKSTTR